MDVSDQDRETLLELLMSALNKVRKAELKKLADKYKLYLSDGNTVDIAKLNMATVSQLKRDFKNLPDEQLRKLLIELYGSSKITSTEGPSPPSEPWSPIFINDAHSASLIRGHLSG